MADVYREVNCSVCTEKTIKWNHFACLVCPEYYLCLKCHEENCYSKPHRPYHPMQQKISREEFYKFTNGTNLLFPVIPFCCPYCGILKKSIPELVLHCQQKHDGDDDYVRCPICVAFGIPERGLQFVQFMEHLGRYHKERGLNLFCDTCKLNPIRGKRYTCLICNEYDQCRKCYETKKHNQNHMPYHPMQEALPQNLFGQASNIYRCPFCGENGFSSSTLADHCHELHIESQAIRVRCPICSVCKLPFANYSLLKDSLLDHLKNYHGILPKGSSSNPKLCDLKLSN